MLIRKKGGSSTVRTRKKLKIKNVEIITEVGRALFLSVALSQWSRPEKKESRL
jgi:hypothetical protein